MRDLHATPFIKGAIITPSVQEQYISLYILRLPMPIDSQQNNTATIIAKANTQTHTPKKVVG